MNKKYDLCAVGNAIVDLQYRVDHEVLEIVGIEHGEMKLVSPETQNLALAKLKDVYVNQCSGGSAANTLIAFQNFGGKSAYFTSLGADDFGAFYANEFKEIGIDLFAHSYEEHPTGSCVVLITPDAERTMHTSLGATAFIKSYHIEERVIKDSEWLYIEGYLLSGEDGAKAANRALEFAKTNGVKVAFTFSDAFIVEVFRDNVEQITKSADLIFCNEAEAKTYSGESDTNKAFDKLCADCPNVVMTLGANGSLVKWKGEIFNIPPYSASPIDTTGAGDMFAGAFLFGIINNYEPERAGRLASLSAAKVISQMGARLGGDHKELINQI